MNKEITAVIFDLDGVIVSTDYYHFQAWNRIAGEIGAEFNQEINDSVFRGSSRLACMRYLLDTAKLHYTVEDVVTYAEKKNEYYKQLLPRLSPADILPGVQSVLQVLKERGIKTAIASSSKNMSQVLQAVSLEGAFDATVGGNDIMYAKPHPEVFEKAADRIGETYKNCLVIEDAGVGLTAAKKCGMMTMAVGYAAGNEEADFTYSNLEEAYESGYFNEA